MVYGRDGRGGSRLPPLFTLSHVCNHSAREIDDLPFPDFLILSDMAEKWLEVEAKRPRL